MLVSAIKNSKLTTYLNNCSCKKSVFDNLLIICQNDIINTLINSFDKK